MKSPDRLLFGTAGIPLSTKERDTLNGISQVKELGLGAMELEFVHSINITKEKAPKVKERADKENIFLMERGKRRNAADGRGLRKELETKIKKR